MLILIAAYILKYMLLHSNERDYIPRHDNLKKKKYK